jgi:hypothetical protein
MAAVDELRADLKAMHSTAQHSIALLNTLQLQVCSIG